MSDRLVEDNDVSVDEVKEQILNTNNIYINVE